MNRGALGLLCALGFWLGIAASARSQEPALTWQTRSIRGVTIRFTGADRNQAQEIGAAIAKGKRQVEKFFGRRFPQPFTVQVFPDRESLTAFWRADWKMPDLKPEPWMVASGTASTLTVLSPRVWKTQAAEHDPANRAETERLMAHELTHVFHGQSSPKPDLSDMDAIGWFVEGLAVYVSGQLDGTKLASAKEAIAQGKTPKRLEDAWSGRYRYGISGSLVRFIDRTYGRKQLLALLSLTTEVEILRALDSSETDLLERWQKAVVAGK